MALVIPSLKKSNLNADDFMNYRPISNLTYMSKLLEKACLKQLLEHLNNNDLNGRFQSAYKKFHSCETALLKIKDDIIYMVDSTTNALLISL